MARRQRRACPQRPVRERATQPDSPKLSRPPGLRRFFTFPALLVDYRPLRVCALLAPWEDEKNRQQRGMAGYFNRLLKQRPGTRHKVAVQRNGHFASPAQLHEDRDALLENRLVN